MSDEAFQIYEVEGFSTGTLALCQQPASVGDFADIATWKPSVVVTLTKEEEFPVSAKSLPQHFLEADYDWLHLPITDFGIPALEDVEFWQENLTQLQGVLHDNGRILVHCKGGRGRSGMLLLKLLITQDEDAEAALKRIREIRVGAVETDAQYLWATKGL
jgi:protein-tyrosine phosphatase